MLVFVPLVHDHVGEALCNRNLEVHLLEWDHLTLVFSGDSEQLETFLSWSQQVFALLPRVLLWIELKVVWLVDEDNFVFIG